MVRKLINLHAGVTYNRLQFHFHSNAMHMRMCLKIIYCRAKEGILKSYNLKTF